MGLQCFTLRARTQCSGKKRQDRPSLGWCAQCVSLQCLVPAITAACTIFSPLFFCWLVFACIWPGHNSWKMDFEEELTHSTVRQALVTQAHYYERDLHCYFCHQWSCARGMGLISEKPSLWGCWSRHQWVVYWLLLNERCRTTQAQCDFTSTQNSGTNWEKISWSLVWKLSSAWAETSTFARSPVCRYIELFPTGSKRVSELHPVLGASYDRRG